VGVGIYVDLDGAGDELDRLAKGPGLATIARMDGALMAGFAMSEARVHVITGFLKASGHVVTHDDPANWMGSMEFARYPGVFELARGNAPTGNHPEGGHYFFDEGGPFFLREAREAIWEWITDGRGGDAPSLGLGPYSGGDG
jgi:hypothetical protein